MNIIQRNGGSDNYLNVPRFDRKAGVFADVYLSFYIISLFVLHAGENVVPNKEAVTENSELTNSQFLSS